MKARKIVWCLDAWNDYTYWQEIDKKMSKKINLLVKDLMRNPFEGIGKPEPLKGDLVGFWSRRIDKRHRIVYVIEEFNVVIISCKGNYE